LKTLAVAAATLGLAWFSGWAAIALAFSGPAPALAARSPIAAGPALGRLSRLDVVLSLDPRQSQNDLNAIFPKKVSAESIGLARKAFRKEPMSTDALVVLAMAANANGNARQAQALFQAVNGLTRRNGLASMWLAEEALQAQDIDAILLHFDEILRTTETGRSRVLQQFAAATANPVFSKALAKLLRSRPPWADEFWQVAPAVQGVAKPVGELRLQLADSKLPHDPVDDSALADQLIKAGEYDLALRLYRSVAPPSGSLVGDEHVRNGQFARQPLLPPVDWSISSSGDFGAEIRPQPGALLFSAIGSTRGQVARQWVSLSPGRYVLRAHLTFTEDGGETSRVYARLTCIGNEQFHDFDLKNGSTVQLFAVPAGGCRNYWLDIVAAPGEGSTGLDGSLDFISIKPG
jgi:hypothetical protein